MANVAMVCHGTDFPVVMAHLRIMRMLFGMKGLRVWSLVIVSTGVIQFAVVGYLQTALKLIATMLLLH